MATPNQLDHRSPLRQHGLWATMVATVGAIVGLGCAGSRVHAPPGAPRAAPSKTIVLVHGMFMGPSCWDRWRPYLEENGYRVLAPSWPAHDGSAVNARAAHPDASLAALELRTVVDHYRTIIEKLDEPPILVGHSMGGLVVQILLSEGLGSAAIAIDAAPPKGVFTLNTAFLKSNGRVLRGSLDEPLDMDPDRFSYVFANTLPPEQQQAAWEKQARPESRRVGRGATTDDGKVDFSARRGPLLLIAGERDHAVPPVITRKTFRRYSTGPSMTEFREVEGADHWLIASDRWEEVARFCVDWLAEQGAAPLAASSHRASATDM